MMLCLTEGAKRIGKIIGLAMVWQKMVFPSIRLLNHLTSVYTIEVFGFFDKEFIDGAGYKYKEVESVSYNRRFEVWGVRGRNKGHGAESYEFKHIVSFNK